MNKNKIIAEVVRKLNAKAFDYREGHCFDFAAALHRVFGYRLGLLKGFSLDKDGDKKKHILHAFGVDHKDQPYDVTGTRALSEMQSGYSSPEARDAEGKLIKLKLEKFSTNIYDSEKEFWSKTWTVDKDEEAVKKAIKMIVSTPRKYFKPREMATIATLELATNQETYPGKWSAAKWKKFEKGLICDALNNNKIGYWKAFEADQNGLKEGDIKIKWGLQTSEYSSFSSTLLRWKWTLDDKLSNEQSQKNWDLFLKQAVDLAKSEKAKKWMKGVLGDS